MHKSDQRTVHAHPRLGIDELEARGPRIRQRLGNIPDAIRDVMESRPALGEKLAHRRIWARRAQELYLTPPRMNKCRPDSIFLIARPPAALAPNCAPVHLPLPL